MGEYADDIVDGWACGWCMQYFKEEHGYPVLCNDCWNDATPEEREGWQKSRIKNAY